MHFSLLSKLESDVWMGLPQSNGPCLVPAGTLVDDIDSWKDSYEFLSFSFVINVRNKAALALATDTEYSISNQV